MTRHDVENHIPAFAMQIAGPGVMSDYNSVISSPASGGDKSAAIARAQDGPGFRHLVLSVVPGNVIVRQFFHRIQPDHVIEAHGDATRLKPFIYALDFLLIFRFNLGPEHFPRRAAKELLALSRAATIGERDGLKGVVDFRRQQISMLKSNFGRRSFQMNINPSAT